MINACYDVILVLRNKQTERVPTFGRRLREVKEQKCYCVAPLSEKGQRVEGASAPSRSRHKLSQESGSTWCMPSLQPPPQVPPASAEAVRSFPERGTPSSFPLSNVSFEPSGILANTRASGNGRRLVSLSNRAPANCRQTEETRRHNKPGHVRRRTSSSWAR